MSIYNPSMKGLFSPFSIWELGSKTEAVWRPLKPGAEAVAGPFRKRN